MYTFFSAFQTDYRQKLGAREGTFGTLFELMRDQKIKCIVETGCARTEENWQGDGQSTRMFSHYAADYNVDFWSVDNDPAAISAAYKSARKNTFLVLSDSIRFLHRFSTSIDVLYLDSFDFDKANPAPAEQHCLTELAVASRLLKPGALVMVDDTWRTQSGVQGKGAMVAGYMKAANATLVAKGYQDLWQMPA